MGRHKGYDRDEVLQKALLLFWRKGYEGTHLKELVEVTGLNRFSLYKEFGAKEGLFDEAMARYMDQLGVLVEYLLREPHGLQNIRDYFDALLDYKFRHGCFLVNTLSEKNLLRRDTFSKVTDFVHSGGGLFEKNLKAAQASGELTTEKDAGELARFLVIYELGLLTYGIIESKKGERRKTLTYLDTLFS